MGPRLQREATLEEFHCLLLFITILPLGPVVCSSGSPPDCVLTTLESIDALSNKGTDKGQVMQLASTLVGPDPSFQTPYHVLAAIRTCLSRGGHPMSCSDEQDLSASK